MMTYLKSLFSPDETRRAEQAQADQARKLEMDEPMAGAGAQISGEHANSETEKNLKKRE